MFTFGKYNWKQILSKVPRVFVFFLIAPTRSRIQNVTRRTSLGKRHIHIYLWAWMNTRWTFFVNYKAHSLNFGGMYRLLFYQLVLLLFTSRLALPHISTYYIRNFFQSILTSLYVIKFVITNDIVKKKRFSIKTKRTKQHKVYYIIHNPPNNRSLI